MNDQDFNFDLDLRSHYQTDNEVKKVKEVKEIDSRYFQPQDRDFDERKVVGSPDHTMLSFDESSIQNKMAKLDRLNQKIFNLNLKVEVLEDEIDDMQRLLQRFQTQSRAEHDVNNLNNNFWSAVNNNLSDALRVENNPAVVNLIQKNIVILILGLITTQTGSSIFNYSSLKSQTENLKTELKTELQQSNKEIKEQVEVETHRIKEEIQEFESDVDRQEKEVIDNNNKNLDKLISEIEKIQK